MGVRTQRKDDYWERLLATKLEWSHKRIIELRSFIESLKTDEAYATLTRDVELGTREAMADPDYKADK